MILFLIYSLLFTFRIAIFVRSVFAGLIAMNVHFYLKPNKNSKIAEQPIFCYIRERSKCRTIFTGQRILPKYWDNVRKCAKKGYAHEQLLNNFLHSYKNKVLEIILKERALKPDSPFETVADAVIKQFKQGDSDNIVDVFNEFINKIKLTVTKQTVRNYTSLRANLIDCFSNGKYQRFNDLNGRTLLTFFDDFINCLTSKNVQISSIKIKLQYLKVFIRWADEKGYADNVNIALLDRIKMPKDARKDFVTLDLNEIKALMQLNLQGMQEQSRDLFLFQLFTGQRYSDVAEFDASQVDINTWTWNLRQKKGGAKKQIMKIPLIEPAKNILLKYKLKLPKIQILANYKYLRQVCELAGLTDKITVEKFYLNGKITTEQVTKYRAIGTHTARRTFATLTIYAGINPSIIKSYTGHATDSMLDKYFQNDAVSSKNIIEDVFKI